jgi:4-amino-4-deoxy-L-arabinose transferase-like glycosyltransferase
MAGLAGGMRAYLIIAALAAAAALAGVFTLPPLDRDESRYAQATAQMLETGNLVEINFLDEERNKKPVGINWLQAASVAALSGAEAREIWAYRLPSVLGAILAALACFWGGQRLLSREAAFAGAALFAVTALLGIEGGIAKTDAMLAGATTLAMAALADLRFGGGGRKASLLFWFALGLGVLIKGPVTPMIAGLAMAALLAWERRANWWKPLLFWPGPLLAALMVLPWLIAIQIATDGNFLREALGDDLGPKLVSADERHGGPVGYHLLILPLAFFPATLFLVPGLTRLVAAVRDRADPQTLDRARFLIAWIVPGWILFELLPTKLPHYVLPVYPALALVAGWGLTELAKTPAWSRWTGRALFALAGLVFAAGIPAIFATYGSGANWDAVRLALGRFDGGPGLGLDPGVAALVFLTAGLFAGLAGASLIADRLKPGILALGLALATGLGWHVMTRGAALPNAQAVRLADQVRAARDDAQEIAGIAPAGIVTASSYTEPSLAFLLGTDTVLGTAEAVLAFAESRQDPTLVVLDLSRDEALRQYLTRPETLAWADLGPLAERFAALHICRRTLASGTNYSRGADTVLAILLTRCDEQDPNDPQD